METIEELTTFLTETTADGYRGRLQARSEARALIRSEGALQPDSPAFAEGLDQDLADYGFSLLRASMAARELQGESSVWRRGFARAGNTFEALVQNGSNDDVSRGFHRVIGAAAYHLANYSALSFSLLSQGISPQNRSPAEDALTLLIVRDLQTLGSRAKAWLQDAAYSDFSIAQAARQSEIDPDDVISSISNSTMFRALAFFDFALQTGEARLFNEARRLLGRAISLTKRSNAVSLWWILRLTANLIDDLWKSSLHQVLPVEGPPGANSYMQLKRLFIGELYGRKVAEVELWPSQLLAAKRAADITDDLVVALPTSSGKTRIAEIAALMTLSCARRVLIVTHYGHCRLKLSAHSAKPLLPWDSRFPLSTVPSGPRERMKVPCGSKASLSQLLKSSTLL